LHQLLVLAELKALVAKINNLQMKVNCYKIFPGKSTIFFSKVSSQPRLRVS